MEEKMREQTLFDGEEAMAKEAFTASEATGVAEESGGGPAGAEAGTGEEPVGETDAPKIMKVRPTLTEMEVGDEVRFPVLQLKSVRAQASELGLILARKYRTKVDKQARTVTVTRTA